MPNKALADHPKVRQLLSKPLTLPDSLNAIINQIPTKALASHDKVQQIVPGRLAAAAEPQPQSQNEARGIIKYWQLAGYALSPWPIPLAIYTLYTEIAGHQRSHFANFIGYLFAAGGTIGMLISALTITNALNHFNIAKSNKYPFFNPI